MAFIKFSALVSSVVGKLNGSYFQSQKGGTALKNISPRRSKAKATQVSLQLAQGRLSWVSRQWALLSGEMVGLWNTYALGFERTNKNGVRYVPTGYQMFQECNNNRLKVGSALIDTPETPQATIDVNACSITMAEEAGIVFNSTENLQATCIVVISASAPTRGNKNYPKSGYRVIRVVNPTDTLPLDITADYAAVWGTPVDNSAYFFRMDVLDDVSGVQEGSKLTKADAGLV